MTSMTLKIEGMSCDHCVHAVTKAIMSQPGTAEVNVDLDSNTATFQYNPDEISLDAIKEAIIDQGYEVA